MNHRRWHMLILAALVVVVSGVVLADAGDVTRVSVSSSGTAGNDPSRLPSISGDGRYVAFQSEASNLVADDTNDRIDVFVHDRDTGTTTRVSVRSDGTEGDSNSENASISADGRYVAFDSIARNLVADDDNAARDIFVHDLATGETTRITVNASGIEANDDSAEPSISADGRYVAFHTRANNLVAGDDEIINYRDLLIHDRDADGDGNFDEPGATSFLWVSVSISGEPANSASVLPSISADGRFVTFRSTATDLVADEVTGSHIYVHDRDTDEDGVFDEPGATSTFLASVDADGNPGNDGSLRPSISGDGRYVVFESLATDLVGDDTNNRYDIFVHDLVTGSTTRASVDSEGNESDDHSTFAEISGDGRYVTFESTATNLVAGDTEGERDIFVHDRETGSTTRVSVGVDGNGGDRDSRTPVLSADGRYVAFNSNARNLVADDANFSTDVFVYDRGAEEDDAYQPRAYLPFVSD